MATDLETRPDEDQENSRIQQQYDQKLGRGDELYDIADQEQQGAMDTGSDATDEGGSLYREEGSGGDKQSGESKTLRPNDPVNPGSDGLFSGDEDNKKGKRSRFLPFNISRRKGVTGGIISLMLGGGVFFGFGIASGPLQVIHLGEILHHSFDKTDFDSSSRTRHLFRYARASKNGNIGETRVGLLGSKVFGNTIQQLSEIGIEIETGRTGQPTRTRINTDKLKTSYPEVENMSTAEKKAFIADKLGVSPESIGGSGARFTIEQTDMNIRSARFLNRSTVGLLDDGKIVGAIKSRNLTKVFDLPSLFHPWKKLKASLTKKYVNGKLVTEEQQAADEEDARKKALVEEASGGGGVAELDDAKSKLGGVGANVNRSLTFTGFACQVRAVANDIVAINRARVVLPAIAAATSTMAAGSQVKSGEDMTLAQVGALTNSFTDKKGRTIWQSKPLQVLAGGSGVGYKDIDGGQKQAFGSHRTVNSINSVVDKGTGGHPGIACSTISQVIQGVVVIGIAGIEEIGSAGTATGVVIAEFAGKQAAQFVIAAGAMHLITSIIEDQASVDALSKNAFKGPSGGNLYAYGIRAAAGTSAINSGGVALGNNESTLFAAQQAERDEKEFGSKSMFARMFDASDYRSLTGRLADSISPNTGQNLVSFASSFTHIGSNIGSVFGVFTPHASAATKAYDWGFPQYGIPQQLLDDTRLSDPYANADTVAQRLDRECKNSDGTVNTDCDPISRAKKCFAADINLQADTITGEETWDATISPDAKSLDPESDEYLSADCNDLNDLSWDRVVMFVFDTNTMKSAACYQGDTQSCQDIGATATAANDALPGAGGQVRIATFNVLGAGHTGGDFETRADKSVKAIVQNNIDVSGMQEFTPKQRNYFMSKLTDYDNFPKGSNNDGHRIENSIIWNKTKFTLVDSGLQPNLVYFCGNKLDAPWVKLHNTSTGQEFYVLNTHDPAYAPDANNCSSEAARQRYENAKAHVAFLKTLQPQGLPMFYTGDFNSPYTQRDSGNGTAYQGKNENLTYCIMASSGIMDDSYDVYRARPVRCPNPITNKEDRQKIEDIDHVYISKGIGITNWTPIDKSTAGSDHVLEIFDATMPGSGGAASTNTDAASAQGWKWPIVKTDYTGLSECWNQAYGSGHHAGQDIRAASGTSVYAAHDGTVVSYKYNSAGGNTLLVSTGGGLWYNYQHLKSSKVKAGDKVTAGQLVAVSDNTGSSTTGPHLHFGIAVAATTGSYADNSQTRDPLNYLPKDRDESPCN